MRDCPELSDEINLMWRSRDTEKIDYAQYILKLFKEMAVVE